MDDLKQFLGGILETSDWPARWHCGNWSEFHGWLYLGSDIVIWLAYFIIPVILIWLIQKRPQLPFLPVFWLFGAFIVLCGTTHLIDAFMFWWPGYRLGALVRFVTALVSMATVFALIESLPKALDVALGFDPQSSPSDEGLLQARSDATSDLQSRIAEREAQIERLNRELERLRAAS